MRRTLTLAICVSAVVAGQAQGQTQATSSETQTTARPTTEPTFVNLSGLSNDYQVGAGDQLRIEVVGHDDLNQTLRISTSGEISFPRIGVMRVADLTAFEVEEAIAAALRKEQLLQQPDVLVTVQEYQAKPVYVSGAVVNPGEFVMSQELTVADAILLAGGLQFNAADEGFLHRRISESSRDVTAAAIAASPETPRTGMEIVKVDLRPLKAARFLEAALPLRRGDVLIVPTQQMNAFFVVGEVVEPRNYFYTPGQTLTASQAISWAQGPSPSAKLSEGMLVRYDDKGGRTEIAVDYGAILRGKQADFAIQPNDILFIPGSRVKTITHGLLMTTDVMALQQSFRVGRRLQLPEAPSRDVVAPQ